jgi:hypothetical protein
MRVTVTQPQHGRMASAGNQTRLQHAGAQRARAQLDSAQNMARQTSHIVQAAPVPTTVTQAPLLGCWCSHGILPFHGSEEAGPAKGPSTLKPPGSRPRPPQRTRRLSLSSCARRCRSRCGSQTGDSDTIPSFSVGSAGKQFVAIKTCMKFTVNARQNKN